MELTIQKKEYLTRQAKTILKRTAQDIIDLSQICHEYREEFGYQEYIRWVKDDLGLSGKSGDRFLNVYENWGSTDNLSVENIQPSVLYLLSAPSTPESARQEAIEKAESGETVSFTKAKELVEAHKRITDLEKDLEEIKGQIPTVENRHVIEQLEQALAVEKNKPAETITIEKIPEDYQSTKTELNKAKMDLKILKDKQEGAIRRGVAIEIEKIGDKIKTKEKQLESLNGRIEHLIKTERSLDERVGKIESYQHAQKKIREALTEVAITLKDVFEDYPEIPENFEPIFKGFMKDMHDGYLFLHQYFEGDQNAISN